MSSHFYVKSYNAKSFLCLVILMLNHSYAKSFLCQVICMSSHSYVKSFFCQVIFMSSHFYAKSLLCQVILMSSHSFVEPFSCQVILMSSFSYVKSYLCMPKHSYMSSHSHVKYLYVKSFLCQSVVCQVILMSSNYYVNDIFQFHLACQLFWTCTSIPISSPRSRLVCFSWMTFDHDLNLKGTRTTERSIVTSK